MEQRVEWLAGRLTDNVPERHVDRRGGADLGAGAAEADIRGRAARVSASMRLGSAPMRAGAIRSWMSASTAAQPNQLSPSPIRPSSVWTRTQISVKREVRLTVSILVI